MLDSSMRNWVSCNSNSSLIILSYDSWCHWCNLDVRHSLLNHTAFCVAVLSAIYSASVVESAKTDFFSRLSQLIIPLDMTNRFPAVECQSSMSLAQSASENPIRHLISRTSTVPFEITKNPFYGC